MWRSSWGLGLGVHGGFGVGMWLDGGWIKAGSGVQHGRIMEILGWVSWSQVGVQISGSGWARMGHVVA